MNPKVISYTFRNSYKHNLLNLMQTNQENFCHKKLSVPKLYSWLPNDYNPEKFPTSKIWIWPHYSCAMTRKCLSEFIRT